MRHVPVSLAIGAFVVAFAQSSASAQAVPAVTLTRLDCGTNTPPINLAPDLWDTYRRPALKMQLTFSCYLIKHGGEYMVWDTGNAVGATPTAPKTSLTDLLLQLSLTAAQIKYVAISHYDDDHTGQVSSFPSSTLLIGKGDWEALNDPKSAAAGSAPSFANWISGGGKVEPLAGDKDVFGDGTVVMLNTPGHTPGHHSLLVRLKVMGNVLITGDLAHIRESYADNGVPTFNTDRAATLASLDRFKRIAANLKATVIIQHDPRDVGKLPAFPAAAK